MVYGCLGIVCILKRSCTSLGGEERSVASEIQLLLRLRTLYHMPPMFDNPFRAYSASLTAFESTKFVSDLCPDWNAVDVRC